MILVKIHPKINNNNLFVVKPYNITNIFIQVVNH